MGSGTSENSMIGTGPSRAITTVDTTPIEFGGRVLGLSADAPCLCVFAVRGSSMRRKPEFVGIDPTEHVCTELRGVGSCTEARGIDSSAKARGVGSSDVAELRLDVAELRMSYLGCSMLSSFSPCLVRNVYERNAAKSAGKADPK